MQAAGEGFERGHLLGSQAGHCLPSRGQAHGRGDWDGEGLRLIWCKHHLNRVFCTTGQLDEVPHQSHLHLPSDQRLRGGRVLDARHLLPRRRRSHQQLPHPEPTQVRRGFRRGRHIRTHTQAYVNTFRFSVRYQQSYFEFKVDIFCIFLQSRCTTRQKTNCTRRIPKMHTYCIVPYCVIHRCTTPWADLSLGASFFPLT